MFRVELKDDDGDLLYLDLDDVVGLNTGSDEEVAYLHITMGSGRIYTLHFNTRDSLMEVYKFIKKGMR